MAKQRKSVDWSPLKAREIPPDSAGEAGEDLSPRPPSVGVALPPEESACEVGGEPPRFSLRVNDLKQFAYCPRIVFYHYAMPVDRKATFKMEHGKIAEATIGSLEKRRKLKQYGLGTGERRFHLQLFSPVLGLSGRLDLLIVSAGRAFPVDFKDTHAPVQANHRVQLCAYAMLVEDVLGIPVDVGFIFRVPRDDITDVTIDPALRAQTTAMMRSIRDMVAAERMPPPTDVRARCSDCEYANYCGDVF